MTAWFLAALLATFAHAEEVKYGSFGKIRIHRGPETPRQLVIVMPEKSSPGWAPALAKGGTVVAEIGPAYAAGLAARTKKKCVYPAGDFELLSKYLQTKLKFPVYQPPILVGEGQTGVLAYGALAQAPKDTFAGAVSAGFCPAWRSSKSFCVGYGLKSRAQAKGFALEPFGKALPGWRVVGAGQDCGGGLGAYVAKVNGAEIVGGPAAEGVSGAVAALSGPKNAPAVFHGDVSLEGLPLTEVPPKGKLEGAVIFYSGDGGWAGFDQELAEALAARGLRVIGLSTLKYFWSPKTPESSAEDLAKLVTYFTREKNAAPLRLVGYSFGADVMPELVSRLPAELRARVKSVSLLGLSDKASFEFHFTDWIGGDGEGLPIEPVLKKISADVNVRCLYGEDEDESLCARLDPKKFGVFKLPGGHHFDGDSEGLAKIILAP